MQAGSAATLGGNSGLAGGVRLVNKGSMEVQTANNGELLSGGSVLENAGTLTLDDNADLQPGDSNTADKVVNDAGATISYSGSSSSADAVIGLPLTDSGTINARRGTLTIGSLSNLSSGVLTGGSYEATGGTLALPGSIKANAATIVVGSTGGITAGGSGALTGLTTNTGSLTLSRSLSTTAALSNTGHLTVTAGVLMVRSFAQTAGIAAGGRRRHREVRQ